MVLFDLLLLIFTVPNVYIIDLYRETNKQHNIAPAEFGASSRSLGNAASPLGKGEHCAE